MSRQTFVLAHTLARKRALAAVASAADGYHVMVRPPTRSLDQNSRMWVMLTEVSRQVDWYGRKLTPEAWKCVFSASLKKQDVVPGLHGDFVVIGQSTSQMTIPEMSDMMEVIAAFGADRGVDFNTEQEAEHG